MIRELTSAKFNGYWKRGEIYCGLFMKSPPLLTVGFICALMGVKVSFLFSC